MSADEKREEKLLELRDQIPPPIVKLVEAMLAATLEAAPRKFDSDVPRPARKSDTLAPRISVEQAAEYAREAAALDRADEMLEALQEWIKMELSPVRKELAGQRRRYLRTIDVGRVKVDDEPKKKPRKAKPEEGNLFDLPPLGGSLRDGEKMTIAGRNGSVTLATVDGEVVVASVNERSRGQPREKPDDPRGQG